MIYEDARSLALAIDFDRLALPNYIGGASDLGYLRSWVKSAIIAIYNCPPDDLDGATLFSTSIIRDFVHRILKQVPAGTPAMSNVELLGDVGAAFRNIRTGTCGVANTTLFNVWRALGWPARKWDSINGPVDSYTGSHVVTEVFLTDVGRFVVHDAYFNQTPFLCGMPIGWQAMRVNCAIATFDHFNIYTDFIITGCAAHEWTEQYADWLGGPSNLWKVPFTVMASNATGATSTDFSIPAMFANYRTAHDPASDQGGRFASKQDAIDQCRGLKVLGLSMQQVAYWLRSEGLYCCALTDGAEEWIFVRIEDGGYCGIHLDEWGLLGGSIDWCWVNGGLSTTVIIIMPDGTVQRGLGPSITMRPLTHQGEIDIIKDMFGEFVV